MKRNWAKVAVVLSLILIAAIVVMSFQSIASNPSPDAQRVRMYFVFAAYVILLLAVRSLMRTNQERPPAAGWGKRIKVAIGSIAVGGTFFLCGVVLSVVIGGAEAVENVMPKLLYAIPAIAILSAPFLSKRMS